MPEADSDSHEVHEVERWNKTYVKLIGALLTTLFAVVGWAVWLFISDVNKSHIGFQTQLNTIRTENREEHDSENKLLAQRGERIARIETQLEQLEKRIVECERRKP